MTGKTKPTAKADAAKADAAKDTFPSLDFSTFMLGIIGSAYVHMGDAPSPEGTVEQDFELARQNIEILNILHDKTKGNLTGDEERLVAQVLFDLRMRFVEKSKTAAAGAPKQ